MSIKRVIDFIGQAKMFYLATVEDDMPRVRPLGTIFENDGKLYTATLKSKEVAQQLAKNNKVEVAATIPGPLDKMKWLRIRATLVEEADNKEALLENAQAVMGQARGDADKCVVYRFDDASVAECSFVSKPDIFTL